MYVVRCTHIGVCQGSVTYQPTTVLIHLPAPDTWAPTYANRNALLLVQDGLVTSNESQQLQQPSTTETTMQAHHLSPSSGMSSGLMSAALLRPPAPHGQVRIASQRRQFTTKTRSLRHCSIIIAASSSKSVRPRGDTGVRHPASDITVKSILGEGSFGQVFEGLLVLKDGTEERVVLKRVKQRVKVCSNDKMWRV